MYHLQREKNPVFKINFPWKTVVYKVLWPIGAPLLMLSIKGRLFFYTSLASTTQLLQTEEPYKQQFYRGSWF
jgi:hypothetical protein